MAELRWPEREALLDMRTAAYDRPMLEGFLVQWTYRLNAPDVRERLNPEAYLLKQNVAHFCDHLDGLAGATLADKWRCFERFWMAEVKGRNATARHLRTAVFQPAVLMRLVAPTMPFLGNYKPLNWTRKLLPADAPLRLTMEELTRAVDRLQNHVFAPSVKTGALHLGATLFLSKDYWSLHDFRETDLVDMKRRARQARVARCGADALDAALCSVGVFARTPLRGIVRIKHPKPGPGPGSHAALRAALSRPGLGAVLDDPGEDPEHRAVLDLH